MVALVSLFTPATSAGQSRQSREEAKKERTEPLCLLVNMSFNDVFHDGKTRIEWMSYIMALMALIVAIVLQFQRAPYGRYSGNYRIWGIGLPARMAWFLQELPSLSIAAYFLYTGGPTLSWKQQPCNCILMLMFVIHYIQRTFVFPYLIRGGKPTPLIPFLMALVFCAYNGYMQAYYHTHLARYSPASITSPSFIIGVILFFAGMAINIHSDHVLRNLRKPGETGYKIPKGGMFEYVSGANFFGEILEWFGFCVAAGSLPAFAFFLFTSLNIGPRATTHHQWYLEKFGSEYPPERRAILPFIF